MCRCYVCDKSLSEKEVVYNEELKHQEPCTECLDIALDAAYSNGFTWYDYDDEDLILLDDEILYGDAEGVVFVKELEE